MATGWLAWTCLLLAATSPDEVFHMNQRAFQIPISVEPNRRAEVRELILYLSKDQGKTWEIYARATPEKKGFDFFAAGDGTLWFTVAVVNQKGLQDPPDIYRAPVGQKIVIDSVKPHVKILSAERVGDEVQCSWEIQETHPEWTSLKLEYRLGESPNGPWTPLGVTPGDRGNLKFKPGLSGDVTLRLTLRDQAGNEAVHEMLATGSRVDRSVIGAGATAPPPPAPVNDLDRRPPPAEQLPRVNNTPVPPIGGSTSVPKPQHEAGSLPAISSQPSLASSSGSPVAGSSTSSMPTRGTLPPLQIVNKRQVKLGFDVSKVGPSGLGSVEVYVTIDEGATWEKLPDNPNVSLPVSGETRHQGPLRGSVTVNLPKDGVVYGFSLVVKSRAGLGKAPPKSGDVPLVRLELDTTMPKADLFKPQPAPGGQPNALILVWKAEDRNLASNPISLEWSANREGPWEFIGDAMLPNTGKYTWQVPDKIPAKVYLKLTVRDTAGNVAVAQTPEPEVIDMSQPEVTHVGVEVK